MTPQSDANADSHSKGGWGVYEFGSSEKVLAVLRTRKVSACLPFMLPKLVDGMTLLDCGCGPGSITADVADLVPSGKVFGVDLSKHSICSAMAFRQQGEKPNLNFAVANAYQLPFPNEVFDGVYAHSLLMHLSDPLTALREMRRVVKSGGFVAVADPDFGARILFPESDLMGQFQRIYIQLLLSSGMCLYSARRQRAALRSAGFSRTEAHSFSVGFGTQESTSTIAESWIGFVTSHSCRAVIYKNGWADESSLQLMCDEVVKWGENPESFLGLLCCGTLAWR